MNRHDRQSSPEIPSEIPFSTLENVQGLEYAAAVLENEAITGKLENRSGFTACVFSYWAYY